jgi:hypothetical protein
MGAIRFNHLSISARNLSDRVPQTGAALQATLYLDRQ